MDIQEMLKRNEERQRLMDAGYFLQKLKEFIDSEAYAISAPNSSLLVRGAIVSIDVNAAYLADACTVSLMRVWSGWEQFPAMLMVVYAVIHKHGISNVSNLVFQGIRGEYAEFTFDYMRT